MPTLEHLMSAKSEGEQAFIKSLGKVRDFTLWMLLRWAEIRLTLHHPRPDESFTAWKLDDFSSLNELSNEIDSFTVHLLCTLPLRKGKAETEEMTADIPLRVYLYQLHTAEQITDDERNRLSAARYVLTKAVRRIERSDLNPYGSDDQPDNDLLIEVWECGGMPAIWDAIIEMQVLVHPNSVQLDGISETLIRNHRQRIIHSL